MEGQHVEADRKQISPVGKFEFVLDEISYTPTNTKIVTRVRMTPPEEEKYRGKKTEVYGLYQIVDRRENRRVK